MADGELGSSQINNTIGILKKVINRKPEKKVIIYLHHHPFFYPDDNLFEKTGEKIGHWLKDGDELYAQNFRKTRYTAFWPRTSAS